MAAIGVGTGRPHKDGGKKPNKKPNKKGGGGKGGINGLNLQELFGLGMNLAHPVKQTKRDIRLIYGPQIRGLRNDYEDYANQMGALYTVLGNQIDETGAGAANQYGKINEDYTQGTQDILGSLAQTTAPDQAAFLNVLGNQALAGSKDLAQMGANEARYNASMGQQAGLENTILQRNAAGSLNDALEALRKQRATDFRSTLDQNRQTAFERMLALKEYQLRAAQVASLNKGDKWIRKFMADMFDNAMPGNGNGKGGANGQGGGNNNATGPTGRPAKKAINQLLQGNARFKKLNKPTRQNVRQGVTNFAPKIVNTYEGLYGGDMGAPVGFNQNELLDMLRKISRTMGGGGGSDGFPGPGR